MRSVKSNSYKQERSQFKALENHLLNTFFSGLYISASELIEIAQKVDIHMDMSTRELLIKQLLNKSFEENKLRNVMALLSKKIDERVQEYHQLAISYPLANAKMAHLASRANATKALLARESKANPYA